MASPLIVRRGNAGFALSFEDNLDEVRGQLEQATKWAVPYAAAAALSKTAYQAAQAERAVLPKVFDEPVPMTANAVLYRKASKDNLTYTVFLRDEASRSGTPPARYLEAEILGGARRPKPYERLLRGIGVLDADEFTVPATGYPLDRFGNIPAGVISKILSQLRARRDVGVMQNATARSTARRRRRGGAEYFVPRRDSRLPRGVYERGPLRSIRMVMRFVSSTPGYGRNYPFGEAAIAKALEVFPSLFVAEFERIRLKPRR